MRNLSLHTSHQREESAAGGRQSEQQQEDKNEAIEQSEPSHKSSVQRIRCCRKTRMKGAERRNEEALGVLRSKMVIDNNGEGGMRW